MTELGPSGYPLGPFYLAQVFDGENTFDYHFVRNDLIVLRYDYEQDETGKPTLTVEIPNPRTGLIGHGKPEWVWFSVYNYSGSPVVGPDGNTYGPGEVIPLFHGRITSIPTSILDETITIQYQTWPDDFVQQKQQVAELLKAGPGYDPIWLDDEHRDDPDSILQGFSRVWSVNPVTMLVTTTDVIVGEDGIRTFSQADAPYDSVKEVISQTPPLQTIRMEATVGWKQTSTGVITFPAEVYVSLTGDSLISSWPHAGATIGGGWSVDAATARDVSGTAYIVTGSSNRSYNNMAAFHSLGELMSETTSISWPTGGAIAQVATLNLFFQIGIHGLDGFDVNGNPQSPNIPFIYDQQLFFVYAWIIGTSLSLRYQADRDYKEILNITLQANTQATVVDPTIQQESELIKLPGVDVGQSLVNVLSWLTVAGQHVEEGTVVLPTSAATAVSGSTISQSPQICVSPGVAGTTEPNFSDVIGEYTVDGTVTWVCAAANLEPIPWQAIADVPTGQLLIPIRPSPLDNYANYVAAGHIDEPIPTGSEIGTGWFAIATNGAMWQCMQGGTTSPHSINPSAHDGQVIWQEIGSSIPDGTVVYLCVNGGLTSSLLPNFNTTLGAITTEVGDPTFGGGSGVQWLSLGPVVGGKFAVPVGGTPGNVTARRFFPTDRGQQAIVAALSRMVARLRYRARVVDISWDVNNYFNAVGLTTRWNAAIEDYRISGGVAEGKITTVKHGCNGDTAIQYGTVKIGATVGTGGHVAADSGQDTYAIDYATDYTESVNQIRVPFDDYSVGYTPLSTQPGDDGVTFPLTSPSQVAVVNTTVGTLEDQIAAIQPWVGAVVNMAFVSNHNPTLAQMQSAAANLQRVNPSLLMIGHEVYKDLRLRPVAGNSFVNAYQLSVTELMIPQTINLSAASNG